MNEIKLLVCAGASFVILGVVMSCSPTRGLSYPHSLIPLDPKGRVYLDFRPISNLDWREYMYDIKNHYGEHSPEYQATWPDTLAWRTHYPEESFEHSILIHANSPVVGITHSQADDYCKWRTRVVNQKFKLKLKFELPSSKIYDRVFSSKKFTVYAHLPNVKSPPSNTFYNLCGDTPEYTSDSTVILVRANSIGQCVFTYFDRTKYTLPGFRCVAYRVSD
ncbi:MAG: hypothetical protein ACK4KT_03960 [Thermaurantimonas sp.]